MERLTEIDKYGHPYTNENVNCRNLISEDGINYQFIEYENGVKAYDGKPIDKLSKLEDIEQELGIPLEVLFKALRYGRWDWQKVEKHYIFDSDITLHYNGVCWIIGHHKTDMYGKTWWLEKPKESD